MKIITEEDSTKLEGTIEVVRNKLYCKSDAEYYANQAVAKEGYGEPVICEYDSVSETGRSVKRYLPLLQIVNEELIEYRVENQKEI